MRTAVSTAQDLAEVALSGTRADECVVIVDESSTAHLRWAGNTLTTNGSALNRTVTVIAMVNGGGGSAAGVVSRSGSVDHSVAELVRAAEHAARQSAAAEDAQALPGPGEGLPGRESLEWAEPPEETPVRVFGTLIGDLATAFGRARAERHLLFGYAEHQVRSTYLASSTGLRLRHVQPTGLVDLTARTADHAAAAWSGVGTTTFTDVDVTAMGRRLSRRLAWAGRRFERPAGRYEVLLAPACVADLMLHVYEAAAAKDALDGRTVFSRPGGATRVGERLTAQRLTLRSDPRTPGLECAPFVTARSSGSSTSVFDNGLPLRSTEWISDGVLRALVQTRTSARLSGLRVTPGIDNLLLEAGAGGRTLDEMVAATEHGLLLTSLWYLRDVDPRTLLLTGLTRDGVYLVENGEIAGAVNNFRFNESPVDLLGRVIEAGRTEPALPREWGDYFTRMAMPALRVGDFNMSSVSHAT